MKKMISTNSYEYYTSFLGAILLAFGLGIIFSDYFVSFAVIITVVGLLLHAVGMYKIYK